MASTVTLTSTTCYRQFLSRYLALHGRRYGGSRPLCMTRILHQGGSSYPSLPNFTPTPSFRQTRAPNPSWTLGQGIADNGVGAKEWKEDEKRGWSSFVLDDMQAKEVYPLLTSAIVPRPIAFVSSISADGIPNLAPFSYFSMVAHNPPLLSISFQLSPRRPNLKDTRENILVMKEFTVNIISEPFAEASNACAVDAPRDVDEWALSGLTRSESLNVKPPWVKESAVSFECELFESHDIFPPSATPSRTDAVSSEKPKPSYTLILGLIKRVHVRNAVLNQDPDQNSSKDDADRPYAWPPTLDPAKLRAISRLGGSTYARVGEGFDISRVSWKKVKDEFGEIVKGVE